MKTTCHWCLRLLLVLLSAWAGASASAELPPDSEPMTLRTDYKDVHFGKFDGHGTLVFQELYDDALPAGWHSTLAYYPRGSNRSVKLSRDVSAINVFLAAEIRRPQTVRTFFGKYLTSFLIASLGSNPFIITAREVENGLGSDPRSQDEHFQRPETIRRRAGMRTYVCSPDPVVKGDGWTVDIKVLTDDGAVEHWLVKGRVSPMRVESFLCEPKEPNGTFLPYVRVS